jgi:anti-sigma factor RsiW
MNCPTDGVLRTFLDGELRAGEFEAAERHLRNCAACKARLKSIEVQRNGVQENLAALEQDPSSTDSRVAYERFQQASAGRVGRVSRWTRPALGWVAAGAIVLLVLAFSPGRSWAQKVLEMLRVQKIAVLPVDLSGLTVPNGFAHGGLIAQFMSDSVVVTMKPGPAAVAADAASASQIAGYTVRTIDQLGAPQKIFVNGEGAFQMTLNRDRLQALVDGVGRSDVQIPNSVDGSLVAVHVPRMVFSQYGSCGQSTHPEAASNSSRFRALRLVFHHL